MKRRLAFLATRRRTSDFGRLDVTGSTKHVRLAFVGPGLSSTPPHGIGAFWDRLRELG